MVTEQSVRQQLKDIGFNQFGWGRGEVRELPHVMLPDEKIFECVNGIYEGGFALLIATDVRVLLVDKKPLNFLTVEDLRFDMINEIDYNHRLLGAHISITSGDKNLKFRSYNQMRLRKLITHVQHCMAEGKKQQSTHQQGQNQHLEQINQQLQAYLMAQHQHQKELYEHLKSQGTQVAQPEPVKPSPELSDYLLAQSLLAQHQAQIKQSAPAAVTAVQQLPPPATSANVDPAKASLSEIYADGMQEVFGKQGGQASTETSTPVPQSDAVAGRPAWSPRNLPNPLEINPLRIAYSKLPMALRNRKFSQHAAFKPPQNTVEPETV